MNTIKLRQTELTLEFTAVCFFAFAIYRVYSKREGEYIQFLVKVIVAASAVNESTVKV